MHVPSDVSLKAVTKLCKLSPYWRKAFPHKDLYPGRKKARITSQNPEIKNSNKIERKRQQTPQLDQHNVNTGFARSCVGGGVGWMGIQETHYAYLVIYGRPVSASHQNHGRLLNKT